MKGTVLWTTSYLDGVDKSGSSRLERTKKFIKYYRGIQKEIGFDTLLLIDNCSDPALWKEINNPFEIQSIRLFPHLEHGGGQNYPYCWRGLYKLREVITQNKPKKLIYIDSDGFVLSKKMADWIKNTNTGWNTVWCPKYNFPEASIHVLNHDVFPAFLEFTKGDYMEHCGKAMERVLPFTWVNKDLNCDRFGETREPVKDDMDFYSQCPVDIEMKYRG